MSPATSSRKRSSSKQILTTLVLLMAVAIIAAAVWTTTQAVAENMRFAQGTNQILQVVIAAHTLADRDKNFATQPNEDLLGDLIRVGLISSMVDQKPAVLINPWKGKIQSTSSAPSSMRIETELPGHDCRRLALFFINNNNGLGLNVIETRARDGQVWQHFYEPSKGINISGSGTVEDACEHDERIILALVFTLR